MVPSKSAYASSVSANRSRASENSHHCRQTADSVCPSYSNRPRARKSRTCLSVAAIERCVSFRRTAQLLSPNDEEAKATPLPETRSDRPSSGLVGRQMGSPRVAERGRFIGGLSVSREIAGHPYCRGSGSWATPPSSNSPRRGWRVRQLGGQRSYSPSASLVPLAKLCQIDTSAAGPRCAAVSTAPARATATITVRIGGKDTRAPHSFHPSALNPRRLLRRKDAGGVTW